MSFCKKKALGGIVFVFVKLRKILSVATCGHVKFPNSNRLTGYQWSIKTFKVVLYTIHFANLAAVIWKTQYFQMFVKVSATFTSQLMSKCTPLKLMAISSFLKFGMVKLFETSYTD